MTDKAWTDAGVEYQTVQAVAVLLQACIQRCRMAVGLVMFKAAWWLSVQAYRSG